MQVQATLGKLQVSYPSYHEIVIKKLSLASIKSVLEYKFKLSIRGMVFNPKLFLGEYESSIP